MYSILTDSIRKHFKGLARNFVIFFWSKSISQGFPRNICEFKLFKRNGWCYAFWYRHFKWCIRKCFLMDAKPETLIYFLEQSIFQSFPKNIYEFKHFKRMGCCHKFWYRHFKFCLRKYFFNGCQTRNFSYFFWAQGIFQRFVRNIHEFELFKRKGCCHKHSKSIMWRNLKQILTYLYFSFSSSY